MGAGGHSICGLRYGKTGKLVNVNFTSTYIGLGGLPCLLRADLVIEEQEYN